MLIRAKKKFGQNFLKDSFYINKIVESISNIYLELQIEYPQIEIVEIGAGLGDLSWRLLEICKLKAYEIDSSLCEYLEARFPKDRFNLINKDVMSLPCENGWLSENPYLLVGNLPYYIATRIILNALNDVKCKGLVVMSQKEVVEKFCANFSEREFCALSVIAQSFSSNIKIVASVPPCAFEPAPKVQSSVFSLKKNNAIANKKFELFLRDSFASPRKKLAKNLHKISNINAILARLNIDLDARPHQLATEQYHQIFDLIKEIYGK